MRAKENLYVLRQVNTDEVYAISEFQEWIAYYVQMFDGYFNQNEINKKLYTIDILTDDKKISRYLKKYQDYYLYPRGINNKLVLTEWEWNYYGPFFRELYERMKDTIVNLKLFHNMYSYQELNKESKNQLSIDDIMDISYISDKLYGVSCDFDTFVENIPMSFIQTKVLLEPIKAHKFNQFLEEFQKQYRQNWD